MKGGVSKRLETLEERARHQRPPSSGGARERMRAHLNRMAALRRGELDPEEAAEVEATNAALRRRLAEAGGGGAS